MNWKAILVLLATLISLAEHTQAKSTPADGQTQFEQLFRDWQKSSKKPSTTAASRKMLQTWPKRETDGPIISSGVGMRVNPVTKRGMLHTGVDLAAASGAIVRATADGLVTRAGATGNYGLLVTIRHTEGYETRYAHMSGIKVVLGETVRKGDQIGYVGSSGRSTGPHLHYEVRHLGRVVNPLSTMGQ